MLFAWAISEDPEQEGSGNGLRSHAILCDQWTMIISAYCALMNRLAHWTPKPSLVSQLLDPPLRIAHVVPSTLDLFEQLRNMKGKKTLIFITQ